MHEPEIRNGRIAAIILAAGESKRMKAPKMLLPFSNKTIIEKVIENVVASKVDSVMVVLGAYFDEIKNAIEKYPVKYCFNKRYSNGMLSSVKCGFKNLDRTIEAALVFQGDQPMIPASVADIVIDAYRNSGKGIVIAVHKTMRGHPILINKKYFHEIEKLNEEESLRSLSLKFQKDVLEVEVDAPEILRDIDDQKDYINEININ